MDTFEWTKIGGALCGALLFFLMLNWSTEIIYHSEDDHYGDNNNLVFNPKKRKLSEI